MTEFERGRAAGLAEAVKVAEEASNLKSDDDYTIAYQNASKWIACSIRALAASPPDHVLVRKADLDRINALSAPSQYRMPDENLVNLRVVNDLIRTMIAQSKAEKEPKG